MNAALTLSGLMGAPTGFKDLCPKESEEYLKILRDLVQQGNYVTPIGPSFDHQLVLPKHMRPENFFTLEEASFLQQCGLNELFLLEYVLHRWTDYIANLEVDAWTEDHINADISEYIDGVTRFDSNGTSRELDFFNNEFGRFMDVLRRVKVSLKPYLDLFGSKYLDETVCVITPNLTHSTFMTLEFIENEPNRYREETVVGPRSPHISSLPIFDHISITCADDIQQDI